MPSVETAQSDQASLGTRASAGKDAVSDKIDQTSHEVRRLCFPPTTFPDRNCANANNSRPSLELENFRGQRGGNIDRLVTFRFT